MALPTGDIPLDAVIFDFNGTLFRDEAFHDEAWSAFADKYGLTLNPGDIERHVIGFANSDILAFLFGRRLSDREADRYAREKEALYRDCCRRSPEQCVLAPGAEAFLDFLKEHHIKRTIATASIAEAVAFFFETFELERWFVFEDVAYDDGILRGKPFPDMFLAASRALDTPMSRCMVIEDSLGGVQGAIAAGAGRIVAISPTVSPQKFRGIDGIHQKITDFGEIDRNCLSAG